MHRKNPIGALVYNSLFPTPSPTDPSSFSAHLSKNLVGEVRIETANFYGSLVTIEARYPGLNYAFAPHRKRLGRFPHHRRLFDAFDRLRLTEAEIQGFCRWEGTLWARERYERDEGVRVEDTTGVEIKEWIDRRGQLNPHSHNSNSSHNTSNSTSNNGSNNGINVKTDIEVEIEQLHHHHHHHNINNARPTTSSPTTHRITSPPRPHPHPQHQHHQHQPQPLPPFDTDMPDSDTPPPTLNARLLHVAALLRDHGPATLAIDPDWEQYFKEAQERGELNIEATRDALRSMAGQIAVLHQRRAGLGLGDQGHGVGGGSEGASASASGSSAAEGAESVEFEAAASA